MPIPSALPAEVVDGLDAMLRNETDLAFKRRVPIVLRYLDPQPTDRILDCGCGMGFNLRALSELYQCSLVGVERNPVTLKRTRRELEHTRVRIVRGDALRLPFPDGTFDKILMTEVLEHIPDEAGALAEIYRVLRPGGRYVLSVPHHNYPFWWDPLNKVLESTSGTHVPSNIWWLAGVWADHLRLYTPAQLHGALSRAGFVVEDTSEFTHFSLPFHHFLVYGIGKNLIQRGLLPEGLAKSADRFRGRENAGSSLNPMNGVLGLLRWIDRRNDGLGDSRLTYVDIAAAASKPA